MCTLHPRAAVAQVVESSPVPSPMPEATATPASEERRALPAPADSLFPVSDFTGPTIGVPTDRGIRIYGWVNMGAELSTSKESTFTMSYNVIPNTVQLDQAVLRFERQPDTVQTQHTDWGFRLSNVYGIDYRFTTSQGWWSDQLLKRNQIAGYDLPEVYGILYLPKVGQGTTVQIGRYISPPDIEAQLAPNNFLYSHSVMFTFDCYTQTGVLFTTKLSNYWTILYGLHSGDDVAPWDGSAHIPTLLLFGRWISHSNKDSVLFGIDSLNNGQFRTFLKGVNPETGQPVLWGHDNLQQSNITWTHVFSPGFQTLTEFYNLYQFNAYVGGTINNGPFRVGAGGGPGAFIPGRSTAFGVVNYTAYKFTPRDFWLFRTDYFNDPQGQRSGFATSYGSLSFGITHRFNSTLEIRPEYRIEESFQKNVKPYDNGTKNYQSSFGIDFIQNFGNP
jgi:hypothetical protein